MEWMWYLIAYGLGSISFGIIISKYLYQVDIRKYGSNNPGATNVSVVLGKKAGFYVLLGDLLKGSISLLIPILFKVDVNLLYVGAFAVIGHCFPVWWKFRGGKAVATSAGVLLVYNPYLALLTVLGAIIIILITRYGYLGSISIGFILFSYSLVFDDNKMLFFLFIFLLLFLHRSNFYNYLVGSEPKNEMGINTLLSIFSSKLKKIIL
ncbi:acyl-phosphate glycerol 3-phosphate acyltransferase [Priestia megaterium]|uniref:glycerol-3-phosphate 1-O-acyltransferase PlsY n=1 Tax=Priestia megaterium TaxID=1404 RepID=UPI00094D7714|nr:glycerol-3-phosphate 1-O-acyltransferase PlsY [Priestia megaterium]OLO26584.1 acyl-phosphate glycerol 3-phosphate acyltransferase [Priestia megaterium]